MAQPARRPESESASADPVLAAIENAPVGPPWSDEELRAIELARESGESVDAAAISAEIAARRCPGT